MNHKMHKNPNLLFHCITLKTKSQHLRLDMTKADMVPSRVDYPGSSQHRLGDILYQKHQHHYMIPTHYKLENFVQFDLEFLFQCFICSQVFHCRLQERDKHLTWSLTKHKKKAQLQWTTKSSARQETKVTCHSADGKVPFKVAGNWSGPEHQCCKQRPRGNGLRPWHWWSSTKTRLTKSSGQHLFNTAMSFIVLI